MQKKRIYDIILILGLIGAFGFLGWSIWKNNRPEKPAEIKILPESVRAAGSSVEIGKTEDGQQVATFLSYPKYYQDEKKEWQAVETDIEKVDSTSSPQSAPKLPSGQLADWKVDKGVWKFYATNDGAVAADNAGIQLETKLKALVYFDAETKKVATIYSRDTQQVVAQPVVAQNQIIWPNIIDGVDYKITYINDLMKEEMVMSDATRQKLPAPESLGIPSDRAYLGFLFERPEEQIGGLKTFAVESQGPTSAGLRSDLSRREVDYGNKAFETEGAVEFTDAEGNKVQTIEAGFVELNRTQNTEPGTDADKQLPLLKIFYKENPGEVAGKKLLFSGSKYADIQNLPEGDLLFDPTVSFQDMSQNATDANFIVDHDYDPNSGYLNVGYNTITCPGDNYCRSLIRFPNFSGSGASQVPENATVTNAYLSLYHYQNTGSTTVGAYQMLDQWNGDEYGNSFSYMYAQNGGGGVCIDDIGGISASDTSVTVDDCSGGAISGGCSGSHNQQLLKIDNEIMWYTSCGSSGRTFSGLIRGISGTTADSHVNNTSVDLAITWVESGGSDGPSGNSVGSLLDSESLASLGWKNFDITSAAQDWVTDPDSNYGVLLKQSDTVDYSKMLADSDYTNINLRPKLVVAYTIGESGQAGLVNAYESNDTSVSPSSPGTATTIQNFALATEAEDSGFWTTALSTTDNGYDSQVFKMQVPSAASTAPITVNWQGHGESESAGHPVSLNIWNFNSSAWEELDSGDARYNDTFTNRTSELNATTSWGTLNINALVFDTSNETIYIAGGGDGNSPKFAKYNPSLDSFTDLTSKINAAGCQWDPSARSVKSLTFDSSNKEIYLGGESGNLCKYNPAQDSMTDLNSVIDSIVGSIINLYSLVFDSNRNIIYIGGDSGTFIKYDPATNTATDLTSKISSFWSTNSIYSLAFDLTDKNIYLGGLSGKFAKYDPATEVASDLTATLGWGVGTAVSSLTFDPTTNAIYASGWGTRFSRYLPALNIVENLVSYLPGSSSGSSANSSAFDPANKILYRVGNQSMVTRYFPSTLSSQSLTNTVYDTIGSIQLNASAFDTANKVLYIGGASGKFGKYAVSSNTTLSGSVSSSIENYRDSSGYAWLWVKAMNEWSPPSVTNVSSGTSLITWTTGEGADGAVASDINASHSGGSWSDYPFVDYENDAGWKTSHSLQDFSNCGETVYYRVRSCDQWGSCTVSAEYSYYAGDCGGTCPHLYLWNGEKWDFKTNTFGSGGLAKLQAGTPGFVVPVPNQIYTFDQIVPNQDGQLEVREFSDLDEINYFDRLKLYSVNIPEGYTLASENPTIGSPPGTIPKLHTFKTDVHELVSAKVVETGEDVLDKIKNTDQKILTLGDDPENYDYKTLELDFGDIAEEPVKKLVVMGNSTYPQTKEGIERKKQFGKPEKLFVEDSDGQWVEVPPAQANFIKPPPFDIYQVFDLSNIFISKSAKLRIKYLYKTYLDQIAMDFTPDYAPLEKMEIQPDSMILRGYNYFHPFDEDGGRPDYDAREMKSGQQDYPGYYTRYGDVSELMREADDKFVTLAKGDEVAATFDIPTEPVPGGMKRVYVVDTFGFYKAEGKSQVPMTVEPLPFAAMSNFPYPAEEYPYTNDADYQKYLSEWNTRLIDKDHKFTDYLPWQEKINSDMKNIFEKGKDLLDNLVSLNIGGDPIRNSDNGISNGASYTMHAENSNGSADTDFIEMSVDSETRLKGGITLPGGVRLK